MLSRRSIFYSAFLLILIYFCPAYPSGDLRLELEPIVIARDKLYLLNYYVIETADFQTPGVSPVETLRSTPVDLQSRTLNKGIQSDFSLRGSNYQGVTVLVDGQRVNDPQTAHHNSDIPLTLEDIEKIEVIPGLGSSLFGPDSIGGAISIVTKKPQERKRTIALSGGSFGTKSASLSISERIQSFGVRFSAERDESDGFRDDTDFKKFTTSLSSNWQLPYGEYNFNLGYQEKEFGAFDFYTPGLGYPSKEWTKTYLLTTGLDLDAAGFIIKPNFLWRRHYDRFMLDETELRYKNVNRHRTDVVTPGIYLQSQTDILGKTGFGAEYGEELIESTNLGNHNRSHRSLFLDDNKDLTRKLSLGLSGRVDDFDGFDESLTGSGTLRYRLFEADAVHLSVSRSIRVPVFTELYYNDPTTIGDSGLSAEESLNYQIGYDYAKGRFSGGLTFFLRQEENMIDWVKRTRTQAKWKAENITESEVKGIEHYLKFNITKSIAFDSNYTYIDKRTDSNGYIYKYGANYIKHLVNANLLFTLPFGVQRISATYKKRPVRDGWFLLDAYLSCNVNKNARLFLTAGNLLNVGYEEIEGIPQPDRWIEGGLKFEF